MIKSLEEQRYQQQDVQQQGRGYYRGPGNFRGTIEKHF